MVTAPDAVVPAWIALDVGGANIKVAHSSGAARTVPFEVWKRPDELADKIAAITATMPSTDCAAVTMTAELCDCYPTKAVGVDAVLDAVIDGLPARLIAVWGVDGLFHSVQEIRVQPLLAAAANWIALATVAARLILDRRGLLIDIGSTTTDLIPLASGLVMARGKSDTERLQTGELVYAGVRRTPLCALATELPIRGVGTGLAAEIFASTLDVYLTLGEIASNLADLDTADGRPATVDAARDRLARMVCADRELVTADDALALAQAADRVLLDRLMFAADRACGPTIGRPQAAVVSGSGEFLARRLAGKLCEPDGPIVSLKEAWGPLASAASCAFALLKLARERLQPDAGSLRDLHSGRVLDGQS
jgi:(4-(4-[2-(gamma-L-glutamylamino)ethyl]phenoxymethyl)furan-2-yl)methanamine synthase